VVLKTVDAGQRPIAVIGWNWREERIHVRRDAGVARLRGVRDQRSVLRRLLFQTEASLDAADGSGVFPPHADRRPGRLRLTRRLVVEVPSHIVETIAANQPRLAWPRDASAGAGDVRAEPAAVILV